MHSQQPASEQVVANSLPADGLVGVDGMPNNAQMNGEPEMSDKTSYLPALK